MDPKSASNLSFVLNKPHDVHFSDKPVPLLKSPFDVLVAVNWTGICGSDVHYWEHGAIGDFVVKDPMVLGHESAGTVVEVGSEVRSLKPGDRIALEPGYPCRRCSSCLGGKYNLCPEMRFAATPPHDGTLTGFWTAPEDFCYKLPDGVSLQEGALIEPLAVAVHITRQANVAPGQSVVVMGAGPVGLLCAAVARAFGASKVVSVDIVESKLEFAKSFYSTHSYISQRVSAEENAANIKKEADLGSGADVVIDASGAEPSIQTSLHVVRVGGTYVQGGMGRSEITFPIMALCVKEVTAKGSFRYGSGDYRLALELVGSGKVDVKRLISGTVPFKEAEEAFKKVKQGEVIKILIAGPNEEIESSGADQKVESKESDQKVGTNEHKDPDEKLESHAVNEELDEKPEETLVKKAGQKSEGNGSTDELGSKEPDEKLESHVVNEKLDKKPEDKPNEKTESKGPVDEHGEKEADAKLESHVINEETDQKPA